MDMYEMVFDKKFSNFWELELIGIEQEENFVLEIFKEIVILKNQRYEEGFLWKEVYDLLFDNRSFS